MGTNVKKCNVCNKEKLMDAFSKKPGGFQSTCRDCKNAKDKAKRDQLKLDKQFEIF